MKAHILRRIFLHSPILVFLAICLAITSASAAAARELVLWDAASPDRDPQRFETFRRFEQENPQYKVKFEAFAYKEMRDKFITASIGGVAPDVIRYSYASEMAGLGLIEPLDKYMSRSIDIRKEDFHPLTLGPINEMDGSFWGLPFNLEFYVVLYNQDHWDAAGLSGAPGSWDELTLITKKLTRTAADGRTEVYGLQPKRWQAFIANSGAPLLSEPNEHGVRKTNLAHPAVVDTFAYLQELFELGVATHPRSGSPTLVSGQVAMSVDQSSRAHDFRPEVLPEFRFGAFLVPSHNGGSPMITGNAQDAVMVTKSAKDKEGAWKLAKAYAGREAVASLWAAGKYGMLPPYRDLLKKPMVTPAYEPWHKDPYLRTLALLSQVPNVRPMDFTFWHPERDRITSMINSSLQQMRDRKASVRAALEDVGRQIEAVLAEYEETRKERK